MTASITGGLALKSVSDYSMLVGVGLATIFLLCAAFTAGRKQEKAKSQ
jgi:hypothetical protein